MWGINSFQQQTFIVLQIYLLQCHWYHWGKNVEKSLCVVREIQYGFVIIWEQHGVFFKKNFFWMWTIFKVFIELVKTLLACFIFRPWGMWVPDHELNPFTTCIERQSLNQWTTREVPRGLDNLKQSMFIDGAEDEPVARFGDEPRVQWKVCLITAMVFPVVMYACESWTIKKAECQRIDAFEMWCWRRLLKVPWTGTLWDPLITGHLL